MVIDELANGKTCPACEAEIKAHEEQGTCSLCGLEFAPEVEDLSDLIGAPRA